MRQVFGIFHPAGVLEHELLAGVLPQPARDLHGADVVRLPVVRAAFRHQNTVAVFQSFDRPRAAHERLKVALVACEEDRKRGERHIARRIGRDFREDLRVRDDEARLFSAAGERLAQFKLLGDDRDGVGLENVADGLLLRQDEPALGRRLVDGRDQHDEIRRAQQVTHDLKFIGFFRHDFGERELEFFDTILRDLIKRINSRKTNRYKLNRVGGRGNIGGGQDNQGRAGAVASSPFTDKPATSFYLTEDHNDIGDPNHQGGPADLWLPTELMTILDDARQWHQNREWYLDHRLPWRRGYLLHGLPGTGKTSIARAVGIDLDMPIYAIDLQSMTNSDLSSAFDQARQNTPCMLLFEDLDSVYKARTSNNPNTQLGTPPSFDLLLNQIQGVGSNDGVMVMVTTNHVDTIDQALGGPAVQSQDGTIVVGDVRPRPGRIDRMVKTPDVIDMVGRVQLAERMLENHAAAVEFAKDKDNMTPAQYQEALLTKAQEKL